MHSLYKRSDPKPRLLYVKAAPQTWQIGNVFAMARAMSPCLLVMEDIETIVTPNTRAYAFNEMDGLQNNNGIFMLATTNYLDRLDPGLAKRPSRFDRKYLFPQPNHHERTLYTEYWRRKLAKAPTKIPFPEKLCPAIADITEDFSFAYMQEAFIATLLAIARDSTDEAGKYDGCEDVSDLAAYFRNRELGHETGGGPDHSHPELDGYKLWRAMKAQVKILRQDMGSSDPALATSTMSLPRDLFPHQQDETEHKVPSGLTSQLPIRFRVPRDPSAHLQRESNEAGISMPPSLAPDPLQPMIRSTISASTCLPEYSGGRTFEAQQARASSPSNMGSKAGAWQGSVLGRGTWM